MTTKRVSDATNDNAGCHSRYASQRLRPLAKHCRHLCVIQYGNKTNKLNALKKGI